MGIIAMPLSELRNWYLAEIEFNNLEMKLYIGSIGTEKPTLTGWIKYWRKHSHNTIYYPKSKAYYKCVKS